MLTLLCFFFFFQAEDGIRDWSVTGVQTCALPIFVKAKPEPGLWLEEVPVPKVRGDEVLIRVLKASICGTDVHIYNWDARSEERRVGKECRSRCCADYEKKSRLNTI